MADQQFDFNKFLGDQGLTLSRMGGDGIPIVKNAHGDESVFNVNGFLKDNGMSPDKVQVEYNTPQSAVPYSPLSLSERASQAFADPDSHLKFLNQKFDGVQTDAEKGLVVKNKGVWQQVDPSFFGNANPWDVAKAIGRTALRAGAIGRAFVDTSDGAQSKDNQIIGSNLSEAATSAGKSLARPGALGEMAGDVAEAIPGAISQAGQAAGAAVGSLAGPVGGAVGAGIGGGAASKLVTSLGRYIGTYNSDAKTELKENLLDGIFSMAGQGIAAGVRPTMQMFDKAFGAVSKEAAEGVKKSLATALSATSGADAGAIKSVMDDYPAYAAQRSVVEKAAGSGSQSDVLEAAGQRLQSKATELLQGARPKLTEEYGKGLTQLFTAAEDKGLKVNFQDVIQPAVQKIQDLGIGSFEKTSSGGLTFNPYSQKEVIEMEKQGITNATSLPPELLRPVQQMISEVTSRSELKEVNGKAAAQILKKVEGNLNQVSADNLSQGASDALDRVILQVRSGIKDGIGQVFSKDSDLNQAYTGLSQLYNDHKQAVDWAQKLLKQDNGAENLAKKIAATGKNYTAKDNVRSIITLMGDKGQEIADDISKTTSVKELAPWFNKGLLQVMGTGVAVGATVAGKAAPAFVAPVAAQMSPRIITMEVAASRKMLQLLQNLGPKQASFILKSDQALDAVLRPVIESGIREKQDAVQLMQQSRVIPSGQQ